MTNITIGMEAIYEVMKQSIEAEMTNDGILSDVNTFHPIYLEESHIDEPFIWMYQHETRAGRQADISHTMDLVTPFQFNCAVYERELEDAQTSTLNLATRVIRTISKNWQTVQNTVIPNTRLIRNVALETFYPLGTVDVNNKSERLPVVGVVMNVNHIIDWRLCCKKGE